MMRIDRFLSIFQLLIIFGIFLTFIDAEENKNTVSYTNDKSVICFFLNNFIQCWSSSTVYKISSLDKNNTNWEVHCTEVELVEECHLLFVQKITNITCSESTTGSPKQASFTQSKIMGFNKGIVFFLILIFRIWLWVFNCFYYKCSFISWFCGISINEKTLL